MRIFISLALLILLILPFAGHANSIPLTRVTFFEYTPGCPIVVTRTKGFKAYIVINKTNKVLPTRTRGGNYYISGKIVHSPAKFKHCKDPIRGAEIQEAIEVTEITEPPKPSTTSGQG